MFILSLASFFSFCSIHFLLNDVQRDHSELADSARCYDLMKHQIKSYKSNQTSSDSSVLQTWTHFHGNHCVDILHLFIYVTKPAAQTIILIDHHSCPHRYIFQFHSSHCLFWCVAKSKCNNNSIKF